MKTSRRNTIHLSGEKRKGGRWHAFIKIPAGTTLITACLEYRIKNRDIVQQNLARDMLFARYLQKNGENQI